MPHSYGIYGTRSEWIAAATNFLEHEIDEFSDEISSEVFARGESLISAAAYVVAMTLLEQKDLRLVGVLGDCWYISEIYEKIHGICEEGESTSKREREQEMDNESFCKRQRGEEEDDSDSDTTSVESEVL